MWNLKAVIFREHFRSVDILFVKGRPTFPHFLPWCSLHNTYYMLFSYFPMILLVLWVCFFSQTSRRKGNNVCHFVPFAFRSPLRSVARPVWCRSRRTSWITAARTSPSCSPLWGYVCISPWFVCRSWREFWFAYTLIKMRSFSSSDGLCANYKVCSKCIASWCTLMFHSVWQLNLFYTHACRYNFNPDCFSTCFSTNLRFSLVCISLCPHLCFFFLFLSFH